MTYAAWVLILWAYKGASESSAMVYIPFPDEQSCLAARDDIADGDRWSGDGWAPYVSGACVAVTR